MATFSNIGGHQDDPFFRYKMPNITTKVEGSGKMIKTFISNLELLASSLKRQPDVILKYLGYARNVNVNLNKGYISGSHSIADLTRHLTAFIETFVLCANCGLPEAALNVSSKKQLVHQCNACGHQASLNIAVADVAGQKLAEYVIKNNKPAETSKKEKKSAARAAAASAGSDKKKDKRDRGKAEEDGSPPPARAPAAAEPVAPPQPEDVPMAFSRFMMPADMSDASLLQAAQDADDALDAAGSDSDGSDK